MEFWGKDIVSRRNGNSKGAETETARVAEGLRGRGVQREEV